MRYRPRFTVRTLAIFMTVICILVAGWKGAHDAATASVNKMKRINETKLAHTTQADSPFSFLISRHEVEEDLGDPFETVMTTYRRHYVWLFGRLVKLPSESKVKTSRQLIRLRPVPPNLLQSLHHNSPSNDSDDIKTLRRSD